MEQSTRFTFTQRAIEALPPNDPSSRSTEKEYSDLQTPGLKLLVGKNGHKKFLLRYSFQRKKCAISLGPYGPLTVIDARREANELRKLIATGVDPKQQRLKQETLITMDQFFEDHYLKHARSNKRSADTDLSRYRTHIHKPFGPRKLQEITHQEFQPFFNQKRETKSASTVNRQISLLHRMYVLAQRWGYADHNPIHGVEKFREAGPKQRFLSAEEIRNLFTAADQDSNYYAACYIKFLLLTGARRTEGLNAKWKDIEIANDSDKALWFIPQTKSGKSRHVILNTVAVDLLQSISRVEGNPYIFPGNIVGHAIQNPIKAFKRVAKRAGLEAELRLHDLRHTTASLIVNAGGSLYDVQHALGHSSTRMSQRYAHLSTERQQITSNLVGSEVQSALGSDLYDQQIAQP